MLREHPDRRSSDVVIWSATALLGVVAGIAAAFVLWGQLQKTAEPAMLSFAVAAMGFGIALLAVALRSATGRLFLWALAASLMLAFFVGAAPFNALYGG